MANQLKRSTRLTVPGGIAVLAIMALPLLAQEVEVEVFTIPRPLDMSSPTYPAAQSMRGEEGRVVIEFMVDAEGRAFDPVVLETSGDRNFRERAIEALMDSRFEPARLDGEAIVGSSRIMYRFEMEGGPGRATPNFSSAYRRFQRSLQDNDAEEIAQDLAFLEQTGARNRYENAFLGLARYSKAVLDGDAQEQLSQLRQALSLSHDAEDSTHLEEELVRDLRRAQLNLQIQNNFFAEAMKTFELMQETGDQDGVEAFTQAMESVESVRHDDTQYVIPLDLDESGSASASLFKSGFALVDGEGDIAEVVLRCERQYVAFPVEREISYDVPTEWGDCSIQVFGDSDASVFLMQL